MRIFVVDDSMAMRMLVKRALREAGYGDHTIEEAGNGKDALEALGVDVGRGIGMILSTLAVLVAAAGAVMGYTESGGNINDLKDINKLKGGFGQG